jgi:hypothetical protein
LTKLDEGEFAGAINSDIEVELALSGLELCDVDMKIADGIALELFLQGLGALDIRQSADAVALQTTVQG